MSVYNEKIDDEYWEQNVLINECLNKYKEIGEYKSKPQMMANTLEDVVTCSALLNV